MENMLQGDYSYMEEELPDDTGETSGGFISDFFGKTKQNLSDILTPPMSAEGGESVGGMLADAIYQFGRGKIDQAREKAVGAFLMTSEGRKAQQEGVKQTLTKYWPILAAVVIGLILLGGVIRR